MKLEIRSSQSPVKLEQRDTPGSIGTLSGYIAVFNSDSLDMGGYIEQIAPGAFSDALTRNDVVALVNHQHSVPVGRLTGGSLVLREDETGLYFEISLPDTTAGRDLKTLVEAHILQGCSFGFCIDPADMTWSTRDGKDFCILEKIDLYEVSVGVTFPAYPSSSMQLRDRLTSRRSSARARARAKLVLSHKHV